MDKPKLPKHKIDPQEVETMKSMADVPFVVYEMSERRHEKMRNRLLIMIAALVLLLTICNMAWLYVFQSYDYASYAQEGEGYNNIVTGTAGDINNGADAKSPG